MRGLSTYPISSSMFHEKARRPTPIWLAASPARPSWSTVSSRSSTSPRTRSSIVVIGSQGVRRTGSPTVLISRMAMRRSSHDRPVELAPNAQRAGDDCVTGPTCRSCVGSLPRALLRDAGEELTHLGLVEAAVATKGADGGELAGLGPAGDRLRVDAEEDCNLARREESALREGGLGVD